jgi:hypothetical protein
VGVLCPALGVSPALRNGFNTEYCDPSARWLLGARGGSGSASCPAGQGRLELEETEGSYMCGNDSLLGDESSFPLASGVG